MSLIVVSSIVAAPVVARLSTCTEPPNQFLSGKKTMNLNYLDFEQPIADLEVKIEELRLIGHDSDLNISDEITRLQEKSQKLTEQVFSNLTAWQVSQLSRHPMRPYTLDYLSLMFDEIGRASCRERV